MGSKGDLMGGRARDGKSGVRVEKRCGGKRVLEEKDVRWVIDGKVGVVKG